MTIIGIPGRFNTPPAIGWRDHPILLPRRCLVGFYVTDSGEPTTIEARYGRTADLTTVYWKDPESAATAAARVAAHLAAGRVPRVSIDTTRAYCPEGAATATHWAEVAAGAFDTDAAATASTGTPVIGLTTLLTALAEAADGEKILLSPWHEADLVTESGGYGGVRAGSMAEFRAAFQHLHDLASGIPGLEPVWHFNMAYNPTGTMSWGTALTDTGSDGMYPGHIFVDWVGWDPYNWGGVTGHGQQWQSPSSMLDPGLDWWESNFTVGAASSGAGPVYKPIMLGETGTNERWATITYTGDDGDALQWMRDYATYVHEGRGRGKIRALTWFARDYASAGDKPPTSPALMSAPDWSITAANTQKWAGLLAWGQHPAWRNP